MQFDYPNLMKSTEVLSKTMRRTKEFDNGFANVFHSQLIENINRFDAELDDTKKVGMKLVSYGSTIQFHIEAIGYKDPYLIFFYGHLEDGSPIQLVQHVSQISFVLIALQRQYPEEPKKSIGFRND